MSSLCFCYRTPKMYKITYQHGFVFLYLIPKICKKDDAMSKDRLSLNNVYTGHDIHDMIKYYYMKHSMLLFNYI